MKDRNINHLVLFLFIIITLSNITIANAQIAIDDNNSNPDPSAILDIQSLDKGLLIPRMTSSQRASISNPADGLVVYDRSIKSFFYFEDQEWIDLQANSQSGRSIIVSATSIPNASLSGAGRGVIGRTFTIEMNNNSNSEIEISIPIPADFVSGFSTIKVLYSSTSNTGEFDIRMKFKDYGLNSTLLSTGPEGFYILASPTGPERLAVATLNTFLTTNVNTQMFSLAFSRMGSSFRDTSSGRLEIVGFVFDYQGE